MCNTEPMAYSRRMCLHHRQLQQRISAVLPERSQISRGRMFPHPVVSPSLSRAAALDVLKGVSLALATGSLDVSPRYSLLARERPSLVPRTRTR